MPPKSRTEFRTAIICALTPEAEAVEALFDETYDKFGKIYGKRRGDANSYINGRIGKHDIVLCCMPGMGKGSAASVASSLRVSYTGVQLALVVGICGGAPNPFGDQEIFLGDVIISNTLVEYDFGRQYPSGFERKSDALRRPDQEIRTLLAALSTSRARAEFQEETLHHLHKIQQQGPRWQHPGCGCVESDLPDDICEEAYEKNCNSLGCDENRINRRRDKTGKPSIHIGKVATADMIMKSGEHRDRIISKERVIGFEMEGAGVWDNVSCIIIKGVCDYADSHKNKTWQAYAAATGASTAKAFLQYRPVDREVRDLSTEYAPSRYTKHSIWVRDTLHDPRDPLSQLVHQPVINGSQQEIDAAVITGRLLGKPGTLKDVCDAMKVRQRPASSGTTPAMNQHFDNTLSRNVDRSFSCMCRRLRRFQRKTIVRGSLALSSETVTDWHLPGCPAKQKIPDTDQIQLSFTVTSGAGGGSLSPRFSVSKPNATYQVIVWPDQYKQHFLGQAKPNPLLELLDYLLVNKAPANNYDLSGGTPLSCMFTIHTYGRVANPLFSAVAEAILQSNTEASVAFLSEPPPAASMLILDQSGRRIYKEDTTVLLDFLSFSVRIAEAYGCGPLSLAILSNNPDQVEYLVRNHPATLAERNLFGHTPLHLAADKPSCLRLLVTVADTKLLNETDTPDKFGESALETAVFLSGLRCREGKSGRMCRRCRCAECAVILLNADCALPVSENLQSVFRHASNRCKRRYVRHMKDRRDKLKQLALDNLPATEVEQLGLVPDHVLGSLASRVVHLLQVCGVCIPEAITVTRTRPLSIYQALCTPSDAERFFRVGFHDIDSWYTNADTVKLDYSPNLVRDLSYLRWLAEHGSVSCQLKSFESSMNIFTANYTYWRIGDDPPWRSRSDDECSPFPLALRMAWIHELNARAMPARIADACDCKCSDEGCTPLASLLKGMLRRVDYGYFQKIRGGEDTGFPSRMSLRFKAFLKYFGSDLEVRHHVAALRYLTYTALGIPHTCCSPAYYGWMYEFDQDVDEVEKEHGYEMEVLEELMGDFERQIIAIYQDPRRGSSDLIDFWGDTWVRRMREVLDRLEGNELGDEERRKAEEIGVIWDEPGPKAPQAPKAVGNPYEENTLDHWIYELEKIEAECQ
ncbi:hypothetical protein ZTR_09219 [Talaromyces verruculosus]|nr:hypothetical protein ZTR_09219 [Talaromyces verruculosus]